MTTPKPPGRRRRRRVGYLRSGLYVVRPALPAPDTPVGQVLAERRDSLIADLGGRDQCSTAQIALVDLAIRQWAQLDSVDAYLFTLPSLVDNHRRVWPVVLDRARLAAQLETTLARLGLERRAKQVPDLRAYLAEKAGHATPGPSSAAAAPVERAQIGPQNPQNPRGDGGADEA